HADLEERTTPRIAEVRDLRILVVGAADAVADEGPDDGEAGALDSGLHRVRDVADVVARPRLSDSGVARLLARLEQAPGVLRDLADPVGVGAVCDQPVARDPDVDRDQIALLDAMRTRDAVDDHRVRRDARCCREAPVALRSRDAAVFADELLRDAVELARRDPRADILAEERDRLGDQLAGTSHAFDLLCRLEANHSRVLLAGGTSRFLQTPSTGPLSRTGRCAAATATCSNASWISAK